MSQKIVWLAVILTLAASGCQQESKAKLTIATAANMQYAMNALSESFSIKSGISCEVIVSSSGKLTAQILEGAPYDVFVSADMKYPLKLSEQLSSSSKPQIYAYGQLVLWTVSDDLEPSTSLLASVEHIAIANPQTAPYGEAAVQAFERLNIYDGVQEKLVFGESISQVNQFTMSGAAQVGITSKSVVLSSNLENTGTWVEIDTTLYDPIAQGIILLNNRKDQIESAQKFRDYLFSSQGKEILNKFGYITPVE